MPTTTVGLNIDEDMPVRKKKVNSSNIENKQNLKKQKISIQNYAFWNSLQLLHN